MKLKQWFLDFLFSADVKQFTSATGITWHHRSIGNNKSQLSLPWRGLAWILRVKFLSRKRSVPVSLRLGVALVIMMVVLMMLMAIMGVALAIRWYLPKQRWPLMAKVAWHSGHLAFESQVGSWESCHLSPGSSVWMLNCLGHGKSTIISWWKNFFPPLSWHSWLLRWKLICWSPVELHNHMEYLQMVLANIFNMFNININIINVFKWSLPMWSHHI